MTIRNISRPPAGKGRARVHVEPTDGGWQVKREGIGRATGVLPYQS